MLYLFDIDGTLLLTGGAGPRAINSIFIERYDLDGAMDHISPGGKTDPQIIREIFATRLDREVEDAEVDDILREYVPRLRHEIGRSDNFRTMPSIDEAIGFLDSYTDATLSIATGNIQGGARAKLEHIGMWQRFVGGGFGDDARERWGLVATAIDRAREHTPREMSNEEIVVVGDTPRDISAARHCGIMVIAVATGRPNRDELLRCEPDAVFDTLAELPDWHRQYVS